MFPVSDAAFRHRTRPRTRCSRSDTRRLAEGAASQVQPGRTCGRGGRDRVPDPRGRVRPPDGPAAAEPGPDTLPTAELLARLPGRHDLLMAAARRLCVETGDEKSATLNAFASMARAVIRGAVPSVVLTDCWR